MAPGRPRAWDVVAAAVIAAASLALYVFTLQPDFGGPEDTPKFQFIGYVLGVPHPPGYPLYVLLTHLFSLVPIGTIAYRANLFSAVMASASCVVAYAIARQIGAGRWASTCAALGLATGASFWRSAVFAEVYSLAAVTAGLAIALLLAWGARGRTRWLLSAFGSFAAGLGNHLTIVGIVPAFAAYALTRRHRVWTWRAIAGGAVLLLIGVGQYGLIVIRSQQQAPYLETRADTIPDLVGVVTAERFADQRFAFGPRVLLTDHLPALARVIALDLGVIGTVLFIAGAAAGLTLADPRLVLGAAAGMFFMLLNIGGDLKGFVTPLLVLLWPFAALGADRSASLARSWPRGGTVGAAVALAAIALAPAINLNANFAAADQSGQTAQARFLRAVFSQLPHGSGIVAEDYWSDMAWRYYHHTGEAGSDRRIGRIDFQADRVRSAHRDGRGVFAFANAATFLSAEGFTFTRAALQGPALRDWLATLPRGTIIAGAAAYDAFPVDLSVIGHRDPSPPGRARSFEAFAAVAHRQGLARTRDDAAHVSLGVRPDTLGAPLPPFAGPVVVRAGPDGARVELAGRVVATIASGRVLAVFSPDGTFLRALEWPPDRPDTVSYEEAVYRLSAESVCTTLEPNSWTDVTGVLGTGSWVATLHDAGTVVVQTQVTGTTGVRARSAALLGDGRMHTTVSSDPDGDILTTTLTRPADRRPVFRLALDRAPVSARARVSGEGTRAVTLCAFHSQRSLFEANATTARLRPDFESEAWFGAGWGDAERTPTGPVRRGASGATLLLPLAAGRDYRLSMDLEGADASVLVNGNPAGVCTAAACDVLLPAAAIRNGVNEVTLSFDSAAVTLRGGILRREVALLAADLQSARADAEVNLVRLAVAFRRHEPEQVLAMELICDTRERRDQVFPVADLDVAAAGFLRDPRQSRVRHFGEQGRLQAARTDARLTRSQLPAAHPDAVDHHVVGTSAVDDLPLARDLAAERRRTAIFTVAQDEHDPAHTGVVAEGVHRLVDRAPERGRGVGVDAGRDRGPERAHVVGELGADHHLAPERSDPRDVVRPQAREELFRGRAQELEVARHAA